MRLDAATKADDAAYLITDTLRGCLFIALHPAVAQARSDRDTVCGLLFDDGMLAEAGAA